MPKAVDLAAENGREVARAASHQGLQAMPLLAEIYPVGGEGVASWGGMQGNQLVSRGAAHVLKKTVGSGCDLFHPR